MRDAFDLVGSAVSGKYRIDEVIGEGGFGVVYRGHHLDFDQPIAVKCLKIPAHFTREARDLFVERFRTEGRHLAKLSDHPSITRVYDFGMAGQVPYLVLEWLEGSTLQEIIEGRSAPFPDMEALRFIRPAIDALAYAHGHQVVHRDIKPANIVLAETPRGDVLKLLDFGISKAMEEGETATRLATKTSSGFSAFSPNYGAPEQFQSKKFGPTGPWTDVHALGLVLVEMVTGRRAFDGEDLGDFLFACVADERPTPRVRGALVSNPFEALCACALAQHPTHRYQDGGQLLDAVDEVLNRKSSGVAKTVMAPGLGGAVGMKKPKTPTVAMGPLFAEQPPKRTATTTLVMDEPEAPPPATIRTVEGEAIARERALADDGEREVPEDEEAYEDEHEEEDEAYEDGDEYEEDDEAYEEEAEGDDEVYEDEDEGEDGYEEDEYEEEDDVYEDEDEDDEAYEDEDEYEEDEYEEEDDVYEDDDPYEREVDQAASARPRSASLNVVMVIVALLVILVMFGVCTGGE